MVAHSPSSNQKSHAKTREKRPSARKFSQPVRGAGFQPARPPAGWKPAPRSDPLLLQLHIEGQAADLVGEDVEAGGGAGLEGVLALDHRLVDLGPALDVVGLDGEQLLEDVGGAVGLQGPDLHLAEALAAEAGL